LEVYRKFSIGREDPDGQPGDMTWETELEDKPPLENNKVWIGKVRDPLVFLEISKPNLLAAPYHAPFIILHPVGPGREGTIRFERMSL
jgi:hypothetical protein